MRSIKSILHFARGQVLTSLRISLAARGKLSKALQTHKLIDFFDRDGGMGEHQFWRGICVGPKPDEKNNRAGMLVLVPKCHQRVTTERRGRGGIDVNR